MNEIKFETSKLLKLIRGHQNFKTWKKDNLEIIPFDSGHFKIFNHESFEYIEKQFNSVEAAKSYLTN